MPFIPVPETAQINIRGTINGVPMENVLHFTKSTPLFWTATELADLSSAVITNWTSAMLPVLASGYVALSTYARDLTLVSGAVFEGNFAPGSAGSASGETLPGSVAACITHSTGQAGRSFRGRTYIGGFSELSVAGNNLVTGFADALMDAWNDFMGAVTATDFTFVVVSRYTNNEPRFTGIATPVVASLLRDTRVDSQRRRLS